MPPPSSGELTGHRFALRRAASALVTRDAVPSQDPLRSHHRATVAGAVLAVLALGAAAVWGLVDRPRDWRAESVVAGARSGALYVVAHHPDRLVPVPNVASARLVTAALPGTAGPGTGAAGAPVEVDDAVLAAAPRTRPVGIADAPALPAAGAPVPPVWSVCDVAVGDPSSPQPWSRPRVTTTVLAGDAAPGRELASSDGVLLRDRFGGTWLVHEGVRSRVEVGDPVVVAALGLGGLVPRPTTTSLLNAIAEGPPIVPPPLAGRGLPGVAGETVGAVVRLVGPGVGDRYLVVEAGGVQEVPPLVALLVRLTDPVRATAPIPSASPGPYAAAPLAQEIAVASYPAVAPLPVPLPDAPTTCVGARGGDAGVTVTVAAGTPGSATALRQADGSGDRVDAASVPGGGVVVRAVPVGRPDAPGPLAVVSGSGTVYGVPDAGTAQRLGVTGSGAPEGSAAPVPDTVLRLLPSGPSLTVEAATTPLG